MTENNEDGFTSVQVDPATVDYGNDPVEEFKGVGVISKAAWGDTFEDGSKKLKIEIEAPENSPEKETYRGQISFNPIRMQKGYNNSDLEDNWVTALRIAKAQLNALGVAVGGQNMSFFVHDPEVLVGQRVYFEYGPQKNKPEYGQMSKFGKPRQ